MQMLTGFRVGLVILLIGSANNVGVRLNWLATPLMGLCHPVQPGVAPLAPLCPSLRPISRVAFPMNLGTDD